MPVNVSHPLSPTAERPAAGRGVARTIRVAVACALVVAMVCALLAGVGCTRPMTAGSDGASDSEGLTTGQVILGGVRFDVWVADTLEEQEAGLMAVPRLGDDRGMLFDFPVPVRPTFSIKDVEYDLDVIFLDDGGEVMAVMPLSPDGPTTAEGPTGTRWVLEVAAGTVERLRIERGDTVAVDAR